jgi:signal transduction histidine kinase
VLAFDEASALLPRFGQRSDAAARADRSIGRPRYSEWFAPAVAAILLCVFALLLLPAHDRNWGEIALGAAAAVVVVAGSLALRLAPRVVGIAVPIGFLLVVSVLRDAAGGSTSGFGGFFLLPVIYFALLFGLGELLLGLCLMALASAGPIVLFGAPEYPVTSWRGTVVQLVVAAIAGLTIQRLVMHVRADAAAKEQRNQELLTLDRMKDEFMSVISHEFRTPLTSINGYLGLVTDDAQDLLSEEHRHFLGTVERNVSRLQQLVEDMLFVARVEHAGLELNPQDVELGTLLAEAAASAQPTAAGKGVALTLDVSDPLPVHVDRLRIAQLVDNLVSNAVKFTPDGGRVTIAARQVDQAVEVNISDSGVGIPPDELAHLFTRFYRASTARASHTPGTGLGLRISQSIARAHQSEITVESSLGEGSTFTFRLPRATADAAAQLSQSPSPR